MSTPLSDPAGNQPPPPPPTRTRLASQPPPLPIGLPVYPERRARPVDWLLPLICGLLAGMFALWLLIGKQFGAGEISSRTLTLTAIEITDELLADYMAVGKLKEVLSKYPDDRVLIMSEDSEGNGFSPLSEVEERCYDPESTHSGECYEHKKDAPFDDVLPVLLFIPTR